MEEEAMGPAMVAAALLLAVGGALARAALLLTVGGEGRAGGGIILGSLRSIRIAFSTSTSYSASV